MKHVLIIAALALAVTGCYKEHDRVSNDWKPEDVSIACPSGDCPEGVGLLVIKRPVSGGYKLVRCTATMISSNQILTNAHCDLFSNPDIRGYFILPSRAAVNVASISGSEFKVAGKMSGIDRDLAILRLNTSLRAQPRKISRSIPERMDRLVSYVINLSEMDNGQNIRFSLDKIICETKPRMALYGGGADEKYLGISLFNCPIRKGNSGAAAFLPDDLLNIQVVINTAWKFSQNLSESAKLRSLFFDPPDYFFKGYGMGERVQCQDIPGQPAPSFRCPPVDFERTMGDPFRAALMKEYENRASSIDQAGDLVWSAEFFMVKMNDQAFSGSFNHAAILVPKPYCTLRSGSRMQAITASYLQLGLLRDGSASVREVPQEEFSGAVKFRSLEQERQFGRLMPRADLTLPACGPGAMEAAHAQSLKNISALTMQDSAKVF